MDTLKIKTHVGKDGLLQLKLPTNMTDMDCEVIVTTEPHISQEEWLSFIETTAGSLADDPIERLSQGKNDARDEVR